MNKRLADYKLLLASFFSLENSCSISLTANGSHLGKENHVYINTANRFFFFFFFVEEFLSHEFISSYKILFPFTHHQRSKPVVSPVVSYLISNRFVLYYIGNYRTELTIILSSMQAGQRTLLLRSSSCHMNVIER